MSDIVNHKNIVDEVLDLFRKGGDEQYFGEAISQTEHALQSAWLAEKAGAELVEVRHGALVEATLRLPETAADALVTRLNEAGQGRIGWLD